MLVLDSSGAMVHAFAGYVSAEDLLTELTFALDLMARIHGRPAAERERLVAAAHRGASEAIEQEPESDHPFAPFVRSRRLTDHRFVAANPLLDVRDFRPEAMVGRAQTFFGSSTGKRPGRFIGERPDAGGNIEDLLKRVRGGN